MASVAEVGPVGTGGSGARSASVPASLAALVESEIIPRLMMAHIAIRQAEVAKCERAITAAEVDAFTPLALSLDARALLTHVERLVSRGVSIDALLVDLLAPAARLLGVWWEEDRCDFIEVTMGLWRLQEVARELAAFCPPHDAGAARRRSALFATMPEDQHSFGTVLIDEMFRRHGWDSRVALDPTSSELLGLVGSTTLDLVGLTVACDCHIARLPSLITAIRSVSRNPRVRIMVGGRIFGERPELAMEVGADGTAADALDAVAVANELIDVLASGSALGR